MDVATEQTEKILASERIACAIIGGGPAGLTAATYLARFRQAAVVFDDGESRALQIPCTRNVPGFPEGIGGAELHRRMIQQAEAYGAAIVRARVTAISKDGDEFVLRSDKGIYRARSIILATGVAVRDPEMDDLAQAIAHGAVRYCPVCDGFEVQNKRIAVLGAKPASLDEAVFLSGYSRDITLIPQSDPFVLADEQIQAAGRSGIRIESRRPRALSLVDGRIEILYADGSAERFDTLYPCLGSRPRSALAASLGADMSPSGGLLVDSRQQTNIPMVYAAGDVLEGLDQIASACGQAAIAATAVHNHLRER